jgi:hypothetical protein
LPLSLTFLLLDLTAPHPRDDSAHSLVTLV